MTIRKLLAFVLLTLFAFVLLVLVSDQCYTQPPSPYPSPVVPTTTPGLPSSPQNRTVPSPVQQVVPAITVPAVPLAPTPSTVPPPPIISLDQMLDELEALRVQKSELEKKEQDMIKAIQQKAGKQAERLKQLGIALPAVAKSPIRVGRIRIEGNDTTPDGAIMKMLNFFPGQVLEYPELEKGRTRLEKAGFPMVAVEVIPIENDSQFVDVLIKVVEKER
jgi:hypothetical protein